MTETIIASAIALVGTISSGIISSISARKVMQIEIDDLKEDLKRLECKQDKHNNLIERMVVVEQCVKSAHQRIDGMEVRR